MNFRSLRPLLNVVLMQLTWFMCVFGSVNGFVWLGYVAGLITVGLFIGLSSQRSCAIRHVVLGCMVGALFDSLLVLTGLINIHGGWFSGAATSWWMITLWAVCATATVESLGFLQRLPWLLIALIGAISGSLSYYAGVRIGALTMPYGDVLGVCAVAGLWAWALPLLVWSARFCLPIYPAARSTE